ncbi:hypothetical protein F1642_09095 [Paracoccus sp. NBH48]|uniref:hypothetical protein n=1 Tax=Paracoccus sp. NBH48 TaxID=2596918 RepID=UPI001890DD3F|nr:hypothetical protein [Paracoccus sp. NBH48]MBF5079211.1 hypothetical protein [Paracoccus sp. NBH48]
MLGKQLVDPVPAHAHVVGDLLDRRHRAVARRKLCQRLDGVRIDVATQGRPGHRSLCVLSVIAASRTAFGLRNCKQSWPHFARGGSGIRDT